MKTPTRISVVLAAIALVASACGGGTAQPTATATAPTTSPTATPAAAKTVKIYSSLPLTGSSRGQTIQIQNAINMALDEINRKVGNVTIQYESLDDATAAKQAWDATQEAENARKAIADRSAVVYIGTFNSGAAQVSIPILCSANLVMISPANTYPGLTKGVARGAGPGEPEKFYPGGCKRNYTRVVPADDIQGDVAAKWAKELGATKVFIVHDTQLYGKGIADVFRTTAKTVGLTEVGYEGADKAENYRGLATKVKDSGADFLYYGGITQQNAAIVFKDVKEAVPAMKFMGPDGIFEQAFLTAAGPVAEGVYVTFGGVTPDKYTGKSKDWLTRYLAKFPGTTADPYAIYGYEAASVAIDAIKRAGEKADDRAAVRDAVFATKDFDGVLGRWSFDANGDTSITIMSGAQVKSGKFEFVKELK
jgi:branched-chain amino acid transport system substrate-binding protein